MAEYFRRRVPVLAADYEEGYWGVVVDPDGKRRDRLQERQKHIEDVRQELEFLNGLPGGRIVDVGCGLGHLLSGLDDRWERHGVEVSSFAAERAREWGTIVHGTLRDARYGDAVFDAVVLHHVIEHVDDPVDLIREIRRVLKPMGVLLLGTPDFDSACARRFGERYRLLHDKTHISLFTNESMHRFLRDFGFVIDRVEYPYFETRYFTLENLERLFDTGGISPPFYGNFMTFYCRKPSRGPVADALAELGCAVRMLSETQREEVERAKDWLRRSDGVVVTGSGMDADLTNRTNATLRKGRSDKALAVHFEKAISGRPALLKFRNPDRGAAREEVVLINPSTTCGDDLTLSILIFEAITALAASAGE